MEKPDIAVVYVESIESSVFEDGLGAVVLVIFRVQLTVRRRLSLLLRPCQQLCTYLR